MTVQPQPIAPRCFKLCSRNPCVIGSDMPDRTVSIDENGKSQRLSLWLLTGLARFQFFHGLSRISSRVVFSFGGLAHFGKDDVRLARERFESPNATGAYQAVGAL